MPVPVSFSNRRRNCYQKFITRRCQLKRQFQSAEACETLAALWRFPSGCVGLRMRAAINSDGDELETSHKASGPEWDIEPEDRKEFQDAEAQRTSRLEVNSASFFLYQKNKRREQVGCLLLSLAPGSRLGKAQLFFNFLVVLLWKMAVFQSLWSAFSNTCNLEMKTL